MYKSKKISLIFPAYNEEEYIARAVEDFKKLKIVDEIIVINNNSSDETGRLAKQAGAKVILEKKQGYGFALRRGLNETKGKLIVLCEPEGTFEAKDLIKLLKYTYDYDLVMGSRTNEKLIKDGANMGRLLRYGNIILAKLMQICYGLGLTTDCGCTYRVFHKETIDKIKPYLSVGTSHFLPETVILTKLSGGRIKEIPVTYKKRVGKSKITGSLVKSIEVGMNMFGIILRYKLKNPYANIS